VHRYGIGEGGDYQNERIFQTIEQSRAYRLPSSISVERLLRTAGEQRALFYRKERPTLYGSHMLGCVKRSINSISKTA
jgi:hypothetical protein